MQYMHDATPTRDTEGLRRLLLQAKSRGASDIHLGSGTCPVARIHGVLTAMPLTDGGSINLDVLRAVLLDDERRGVLDRRGAVDVAFELPDVARLRAHFFRAGNRLAAALRLVPQVLAEEPCLGAQVWADRVTRLRQGLVLVTGPTGSGKSTTLAMLVERINRERAAHIITIEDPIEHLHTPQLARITQREVPSDAPSFAEALHGILREDPDVVLVGEIRDRETIEAALTIAETGHLVLSSLHTGSAAQAVSRVVDMFAPADQAPIRTQLAAVLDVVVAQQLIPRTDRAGRVLALEVLQVSAAIRNLIREGKTHQLENMMQLGQAQSASRTMTQALADLYQSGLITLDDALAHCSDPDALQRLLGPALKEVTAAAPRSRR